MGGHPTVVSKWTHALVIDDDDLVDGAPLAELVVEVALAGADAESEDPEHVVGRLLRLGALVLPFTERGGERGGELGPADGKVQVGSALAWTSADAGRESAHRTVVGRAAGLFLVAVTVRSGSSGLVASACGRRVGLLVAGPRVVVRVSGWEVLPSSRRGRRRRLEHLGVLGSSSRKLEIGRAHV